MSGPRRAPWVACEVLDGRAVLFDEHACAVHVLNEAATAVWGLLDGSRDLPALAAGLAYSNRNPEEVACDVERLLEDLARLGLLEGDS